MYSGDGKTLKNYTKNARGRRARVKYANQGPGVPLVASTAIALSQRPRAFLVPFCQRFH